jgi:hypothetical protein
MQIEKAFKESRPMCPFRKRVGDAKTNVKFQMSVKISAQVNLLVVEA